MTTDITVRGQARDSRDPDRAVLTIIVAAEARDWAEAHVAVSTAMSTLNDSIDSLKIAHPDAMEWSSTGQASQTCYTNKGVQRFKESVLLTMRFVDFAAMSEWVFANTNDRVQLRGVDWQLSPQVRQTVRRELGQAAIGDARDRADTFAGAAGLKVIATKALADPGLLNGNNNGATDGVVYAGGGLGLRAFAASAAAAEQTIDLTPEPIETTATVEANFLAE